MPRSEPSSLAFARAHALDHTLVVIASDHGESLGEHGERTHGLFAYESTLRVPLILWAPAAIPAPVVDDTRTAGRRHADGARSGRRHRAGRSGRTKPSRRPARGDDPGSYFEALNANLTRNWAPLKGMVDRRRKLIDLPIPELYDLAADPGEQHNLYAARRDDARDLESRLDRDRRRGRRTRRPRWRSIPTPTPGCARWATSCVRRRRRRASTPPPTIRSNWCISTRRSTTRRRCGRGATRRGPSPRCARSLGERPDLTVAYDRLAFMLRTSGRLAEAIAVAGRRRARPDARIGRCCARSARCTRDAGDYPSRARDPRAAGASGRVRRRDAGHARADLRTQPPQPGRRGDVPQGARVVAERRRDLVQSRRAVPDGEPRRGRARSAHPRGGDQSRPRRRHTTRWASPTRAWETGVVRWRSGGGRWRCGRTLRMRAPTSNGLARAEKRLGLEPSS